jgi:hypothetical protein
MIGVKMIIKANKTRCGGTHDKIMTPPKIAQKIINWLPIKPTDIILDPAKGCGAFFYNFPNKERVYFCEIDDGKDFFNWTNNVDWIITNPPYSIFDAFLKHAFNVSKNVCFLLPLSKLVSSMGRIRKYAEYGGVPKILIISASKCGFPFGFPCAAVWFKKGFKGKTFIEVDKC